MVALTIISILVVVTGVVIPQMTTIPEKGEIQVDALHSVQNALHWVSLDTGSAESAVGGDNLTLTMPDESVITYKVVGNTLYRYIGGSSQVIAEDITGLAFTVSDRTVSMNVTAAPESRWDISESHIYQVVMRPSGT